MCYQQGIHYITKRASWATTKCDDSNFSLYYSQGMSLLTVSRFSGFVSIIPLSKFWQSGGTKCGMWKTPRLTFSKRFLRLSSSKGKAPCNENQKRKITFLVKYISIVDTNFNTYKLLVESFSKPGISPLKTSSYDMSVLCRLFNIVIYLCFFRGRAINFWNTQVHHHNWEICHWPLSEFTHINYKMHSNVISALISFTWQILLTEMALKMGALYFYPNEHKTINSVWLTCHPQRLL